MDVEFVTDRDTDEAMLSWFARSRREVFSGTSFLVLVGLLVVVEARWMWLGSSRKSVAFFVAMICLVAALTIAVLSRDPNRKPAMRFPHTEIVCGALAVASFIVTFEHAPTLFAFLLLVIALAAWAALVVRFGYLFPILKDFLPASAHAVHVRVDAAGIEYTQRPHSPRRVQWKAVRSIEGDGRMLYVGVGRSPILVPKRAFATEAQWRGFVDYTRNCAAEDLKPKKRGPMSPYASGFEASTAQVGSRTIDPLDLARRARKGKGRASRG